MNIQFFEDPFEAPRAREEVRLKQLGIFVYEDKRRVAVGFDLTPFRERPSIQVEVKNANGVPAGSLTVIESMQKNFSLTMHLRDPEPTETYQVAADVYYAEPGEERMVVHTVRTEFEMVPGDQTRPLVRGDE